MDWLNISQHIKRDLSQLEVVELSLESYLERKSKHVPFLQVLIIYKLSPYRVALAKMHPCSVDISLVMLVKL